MYFKYIYINKLSQLLSRSNLIDSILPTFALDLVQILTKLGQLIWNRGNINLCYGMTCNLF
jgi:hypothetical protein